MRAADIVVIGGGPGGYPAAIRAAQRGARTVLVDPGPLGGVCLNEGCIPSKGLLDAAELVSRSISLFGADIDRSAAFNAARRRNQETIGRLRNGISSLLSANGVSWVRSRARFVGPDVIEVGDDRIRFGRAIVATGSQSIRLDGLGDVNVVDAKGVLELDSVPARVTVVGAGAIGVELASVLHRFGAQVTVVELASRALAGVDEHHAAIAVRSMEDDGIRFVFGARLTLESSGLSIASEGKSVHIETDLVAAAMGRRPLTAGLGLADAAVETDDHGFICIDEHCMTSNPAVFAIGDVTAGPGLAHRAAAHALVAADVATGGDSTFAPHVIPSIVYAHPQVLTVGHTAQAARLSGFDPLETRLPLASNGRHQVTSGGLGEVALVSDAATSVVLGVHAVGQGVETLAPAAVIALELGAVVDDLAQSIFAHPTLGETLGEVAHLAHGQPVHVLKSQVRATSSA